MTISLTRRACLQGFGLLLGSAAAGIRSAKAAPTGKSAVVSIFFEGGFNALFASPDSFLGPNSFGVNTTNAKKLANGLFVDNSTIGTLGDWALTHMASVGVRHGAIDHPAAQKNNFLDGATSRSYVIDLAAAMGGTAAFKAAAMGSLPPGQANPQNGVSIQLLRNMADVATAIGAGPINFNRPARSVAANAITQSRAMSQGAIGRNPTALAFAKDGYDTLVDSLGKPVLDIDLDQITKAYGANAGSNLDGFGAKLAGAELMIRAGTNVITLTDGGWDTHGDRSGMTARQKMSGNIIPALKVFIGRLQSEAALAAMNISVVLHGDFARSLPSSDHASALSALVIGPNVKVGTTGHVSNSVTLPANTGGTKEMWSYLAAIAKSPQNPFGTNPHTSLVM